MATLVVMAAGMGSRYGGLKQVEQLGPSGETLLDFSVFDAIRVGFERVVFVIKPEFEGMFRQRISDKFQSAVDVAHVYQELDGGLHGAAVPAGRVKPWGTGHAVLSAAHAVAGPFAVINADDFYGRGSFRLIADYLRAGQGPGPSEAALAGFVLKNTLSGHGDVSRGVCTLGADMYLDGIAERTRIRRMGSDIVYIDDDDEHHSLTGEEIVSMNLWGFDVSFFEHLKDGFCRFVRDHGSDPKAELYIPRIVDELCTTGALRVRVLPTEEVWRGITYREDKSATHSHLRRLVAEGVYPEKLWP